jgi:Zn-dependent protease
MLLTGFGWANPVPVNTRYFKKPRRDMALTAAAGPAANLLLALLCALLYRLTWLGAGALLPTAGNEFLSHFFFYLAYFFLLSHFLNLSLAVFNLLPLPPLDGSRIFYIFLPAKWQFAIMRHERTIQAVLFVALWLGAFSGILSTAIDFLSSLIFGALNLISFLS